MKPLDMPSHSHTEARARLLADARTRRAPIDPAPAALVPETIAHAYDAQFETLRMLEVAIGGWKVGAKSPTGPIQGAPLPDDNMYRSPATLRFDALHPFALELEIAFRFGREFASASNPYSDSEVLDGVASICATIEVVASRFAAWPDVDKLWQLADLQNHGALIVGDAVPYRGDYPFIAPSLRFTFNGASVLDGKPANPAGDPRRLLPWVVNHCTSRGIAIDEGTVVTAGTYTGAYFPREPGEARGEIDGLPPVQVCFDAPPQSR
jgi:2-keto-4-pentenoate hydratase